MNSLAHQIRNSTAEFLIFTKQAGAKNVENNNKIANNNKK